MKNIILICFLIAAPFIFIVVFNEATFKKYHKIEVFGIKANAYNSQEKLNICSWDCHTNGCSHRDKNFLKVGIVSSFYDSIIAANFSAGKHNYTSMNLIVFVVVMPILTVWLLFSALSNYKSLKSVRK
jgi:4-amino-4-deoxy-L-arabinose transferase-like glycosyltransferase